MDYLNALLQKQETHYMEEIDFDRDVTVGYDGLGKDLLKAQEVVIHNIAIRCPNLQCLWRFFREFVCPFSLLHMEILRTVIYYYHLHSSADRLSSAKSYCMN
jgi:hypothetical protein